MTITINNEFNLNSIICKIINYHRLRGHSTTTALGKLHLQLHIHNNKIQKKKIKSHLYKMLDQSPVKVLSLFPLRKQRKNFNNISSNTF